MKIWDKLKSLFNKNKALPEGRQENIANSKNIQSYILPRNDGSIVEIEPRLDKLGNIAYKSIHNSRTGHEDLIPMYSIRCPELQKPINGKQPLIDSANIYMDIDPGLLKFPYYAEYIANNILNSKRIPKIIGQYQKYAGGITMDANGIITGKYVDQGIIDSLTYTNQEGLRQLDEARKREIYENAKNIEFQDYPDEYAEDLSKYAQQEENGQER